MNYLLLSAALWLVLLASIYLWKRSFAKAFFISSTIMTVITVVAAAFIYQDVKDLQQNFLIREKLFILSGTEDMISGQTSPSTAQIISAFSVKDISRGEAQFFTEKQLERIKAKPSLLEMSSRKNGEYYKIMVFHLPQLLQQLPSVVEYQGINFSAEQINSLLESPSPREQFINTAGRQLIGDISEMSPRIKESIMSQLGSDEEFKGQLFGLILSSIIEARGPAFMLEAFHDGTIQVIPETISFRLIREMPSSLLEFVTSKIPQDTNA